MLRQENTSLYTRHLVYLTSRLHLVSNFPYLHTHNIPSFMILHTEARERHYEKSPEISSRPKTEDRRPKTEDRRPKTEDRDRDLARVIHHGSVYRVCICICILNETLCGHEAHTIHCLLD